MGLAVAELFILLVLLFAVATLVVTIVAIIDLAQRPSAHFEAAGQDRLVWALITLLLAPIGGIIYLLIGRPKLRGVTDRAMTMSY